MDGGIYPEELADYMDDGGGKILPVLFSLGKWRRPLRKSRDEVVSGIRRMVRRVLTDPFSGRLMNLNAESFLVLIREGAVSGPEQLLPPCRYIAEQSERTYGCGPVCYIGDLVPPGEFPEQMHLLTRTDRDNVSVLCGAFFLGDFSPPGAERGVPPARNWMFFFYAGKKDELLEAVRGYFDRAAEMGVLSRPFLVRFQQDFTQEIYFALKQKGIAAHELFDSEDLIDGMDTVVRSYLSVLEWLDRVVARAMKLLNVQNETVSVARRVCDYINQGIDKPLPRSELAQLLHLSEGHIARAFRTQMGMSISEYRTKVRMEMARQMLRETDLPAGVVASRVGYNDYSQFFSDFKKYYGCSPGIGRNDA